MKKAKERHLFPGNNTPLGFYSYYQYILPQNEANHIFCLKGGPGVGKSTFMKTIARKMIEKGFDVEYLHCSSDPDSLDGIVISEIKVAMVDGTSPHIVDPINPGAVDEIINLGEYWDREGIKENKEKIIEINTLVGRLFKRAYKYIAASKQLTDDVQDIIERETDKLGAVIEADVIIKKIFKKHDVCELGNIRKQFASALTPNGVIHHLETLVDETYKVYIMKNSWGVGVSDCLTKIANEALIRGFNIEEYYCPMEPAEKIEHLLIPALKTAFVSDSAYYSLEKQDCTIIDLAQYTDYEGLEKSNEFLDFSIENSKMLLHEGLATLNKAKTLHDEMEEYYIPYMDFDRVGEKAEEIYNIILSFT